MRLFVAINFTKQTRNELIALCEELHKDSSRGRFALPENLHLTLAFIGEVSPKKVDKIKAILETVTFAPFEVKINKLGAFSRSTLWYAGLDENEPLISLQYEIAYKLAICGFEMDGRRYKPHITLGREIVTRTQPRQLEPFGETITKIELMKSERIGGKLTYTAIYAKEAENPKGD